MELNLTDAEIQEVKNVVSTGIDALDAKITTGIITSSLVLGSATDWAIYATLDDTDLTLLPTERENALENVHTSVDGLTAFLNTGLDAGQRGAFRRAVLYKTGSNCILYLRTLTSESGGAVSQSWDSPELTQKQEWLDTQADNEIEVLRSRYPRGVDLSIDISYVGVLGTLAGGPSAAGGRTPTPPSGGGTDFDINGLETATPSTTDELAIYDISESALRKTTIQAVLALASQVAFNIDALTAVTPTTSDYIPIADASDSDANRRVSVSSLLALVNTFSGDYDDLTNKPTLFSGNYNDLTNKPTIPTAFTISGLGTAAPAATDFFAFSDESDTGNPNRKATIQKIIDLVPARFSGNYNDLTNKPTIPAAFTVSGLTTATPVVTDFLPFSDESETNDPNRKATIQTILNLASQAAFSIDGLTAVTPTTSDYIPIADASDSDANKKALISGVLGLIDVGWTSAATAPSNPSDGSGWYDTANNILKIYDGSNWNVASGYSHAGFPVGTATLSDTLTFVDASDNNKPKRDTIQDILDLGGFATKKSLFSESKFWGINQNAVVDTAGEWVFRNASNAVVSTNNRALNSTEVSTIRFLEIHENVFDNSDYLNAIANEDNSTGFTQLQNNGGVLYIHDTDASNYGTIAGDYFTVTITAAGSSKTGSVYKFACTVTQTGSVWNGGQWYAFDFDVVSTQKLQAQQLVDVQTLFAKTLTVQNTDRLLTMDGNGVLGNINVNTLLSRYVEIAALIGDDTADFYTQFQPVSGLLNALTTNKRGAWALATNASGAPTQNDSTNYTQINDGNYTLVIAAIQQNSDWTFKSTAYTASDFESGDILYAHPYDPYDSKNYYKMTLTGNGTLVGTGNAAYIYAPVTVDEVGSVDDQSDGWRITETPPTDILSGLRGRLPIPSTPELDQSSKLLLSTFNEATIAHLGKHIRPDTTAPTIIPTTFETTNANIKNQNNLIGIQNPLLNGVMALLWSIPNSVNDSGGNAVAVADIEDRLNIHHQFELYSGSKVIKGTVTNFNKVVLPGATYHQVNLQNATQTGSAFTDGESVNIEIKSNLVGRDEFSAIAFGKVLDLASATPLATDSLAFYDASNGGLRRATIATILGLSDDFDINALTSESTITDTDTIAIYDGSASAMRKMTRGDFLSGIANASVAEFEVSNVTETDTDLVTNANDDDVYAITGLGAITSDQNNFSASTVIYKFSDIETTYRWLPIRGAVNGQRFQFKRNGNKIQVRRAGNVVTTNKIYAYQLAAGFDISTLTTASSPVLADYLAVYDASANAMRKMTVQNIVSLAGQAAFTIDDLTAVTPTTSDYIPIADASDTDANKKALLSSVLGLIDDFDINALTAETAPVLADTMAIYDGSASAMRKVTLTNLKSVINTDTVFSIDGLTAETAPATGDFVAIYDTSATSPRKATLSNVLSLVDTFSGNYNDLTNKPTIPAAFSINGLTAETVPTTSDTIAIYDASASAMRKVTLANIQTLIDTASFSIHGLTAVTPVATDYVALADASDSNKNKKALVSGIVDLVDTFSGSYTDLTNKPTIPAAFTVSGLTTATPVVTDFLAFSDESETGDPNRKATIQTILNLASQAAFSINALTAVTPVATDYVALADTSDSNANKKALVSGIVSLVDTFSGDYDDLTNKPTIPAAFDIHGLTTATPATTDFLPFSDESDTNDPNRKATIGTILGLIDDFDIDGLTAVTPTTSDYIPIADASDSDNNKKALISGVLGLINEGWTTAATAPSNPSDGDGWYDTSTKILKIYDGSNWNIASGFDHALFPTGTPTTSDFISFIDASNSDAARKATIQDILNLAGSSFDINALTAITSVATTDTLAVYDASATDERKITVQDFVSQLRYPIFLRAEKADISQSVLQSADSNIKPQGLTWDGSSVLVLDYQADAVWGFTNGARDTSKDISNTVLRSANSDIQPTGLTWDGSSVLVLDNQADAVWGFTNGARDTSKDISNTVLQSANNSINPQGLTWDGSSVLVLDNQADAVWGFTNGARDTSKDISKAVLRSANSNITSQGITWDGSSVLVADTNLDWVWGFTNGARDTSKDISNTVLRSANSNIHPTGLTWDGSSVLVLDYQADAVWGFTDRVFLAT